MERQKPTNHVRNNDEFSNALIQSTAAYFNSMQVVGEEGIPTIEKKTDPDDFSKKDPKAKSNPADPAVVLNTDLKTGSGNKQSHGNTIKFTNVVAKEEVEKKESEKDEGGKHKEYKHAPGKEEKGEKKTEKEVKETFNLEVDGIHYIFEKKNEEGKEQGADGKACWKGYKYAGTDGGKDKCVKEEIGTIELDEKAPPGAKYERMVKHVKKGYSEGGVTKKEKGIAYATAWKAKGKEMKKEEKDYLPGNQEKLDANKNGKIDSGDFKKLRSKKIGKVVAASKKMKENLEIEEEIIAEKKQ